MGKGSNDPNCTDAVGMASLLAEELQGTELREVLMKNKLSAREDPARQAELEMAARAIDRAQAVETEERLFHSATLDMIQEAIQGGAIQAEIDALFDARLAELAEKRNKEFNLLLEEMESRPKVDYPADQEQLTAQQLEARRAASTKMLVKDIDQLPEDVRFQAEFFSSSDFVKHWQDELSDAGLNPSLNYAPATGKTAEDCWRNATRKALGLSQAQVNAGETVASWTSPDGREYDVEIMSEFSKTALFDLILRVREQGSDNTTIITNQQKSSARTTKRQADKFDPDPEIKKPGQVRVTLGQMAGDSKQKDETFRRYSLRDVAREFQIRMLATTTLTESSPHVQEDGARRAWFAHHTSRISQPAVHRAIAAYPDLHKLFKPVATRAKFTDPKTGKTREKRSFRMVAEIPVPGMDKPVLLTSSIYLSDEKKGRGKQPWQIDRELTGARDGSIILSIPDQGWIDLHRVDTVGIGLLGE